MNTPFEFKTDADQAIVYVREVKAVDLPRDLREGAARLGDLRFTVIDTAGLEEATDESLPGRMRKLTERAVDMADICLFLIDGRVGVTPSDEMLAEILRKRSNHVILGVNKAEGSAADAGMIDAYSLGLGEPLRLSAEHGEGMPDLRSGRRGDLIVALLLEVPTKLTAKQEELLREYAESENHDVLPENKGFWKKIKEHLG